MATLQESYDLAKNAALLAKVEAALFFAAEKKLVPGSTSAEIAWASATLYRPDGEAIKALRVILSKFTATPAATIQAIADDPTGGNDNTIETQVNAIVDELVLAMSL